MTGGIADTFWPDPAIFNDKVAFSGCWFVDRHVIRRDPSAGDRATSWGEEAIRQLLCKA